MKYKGTLIAVTDMEKSKDFYCRVLGMSVVGDFGANVQLDGGLFLQTKDTWTEFICNGIVLLRNNAGELYFEEDDIDGFISRLDGTNVEYVHGLIEHGWGQRAVRFYDPDHHMIEVAEALTAVIKRFIDGGLSPAQVAVRMDVPEDYVTACLRNEGLE